MASIPTTVTTTPVTMSASIEKHIPHHKPPTSATGALADWQRRLTGRQTEQNPPAGVTGCQQLPTYQRREAAL
jgi:hypothetical protein